MLRLLVVALVSLVSFFPIYQFITESCGLGDDVGGVVAILIALFGVPLIILSVWKGKPSPEVIPIDVNEPIILELIERSRAEVDRLIEGLNTEQQEAFVKFPLIVQGAVEHVWGIIHYVKDDYILASLDSVPVGEVTGGDFGRIKIKLSEIEDWMLVDEDGKTHGGYSILGLAKVYTRDYGKLPKAYENHLKRFADFTWPERSH